MDKFTAEEVREAAKGGILSLVYPIDRMLNAFADMIEQRETAPFMAAPDDGNYYLQDSRSYVGNCPMWWGKNGRGYVTRVDEAHRYTRDEAMKQHRMRETDIPWLCAEIDALRRPTVDMQNMRPMWQQIADLAPRMSTAQEKAHD